MKIGTLLLVVLCSVFLLPVVAKPDDPTDYQEDINGILSRMSKSLNERDIQAFASVFIPRAAKEIRSQSEEVKQSLESLQTIIYEAQDYQRIGNLCYVTVRELFIPKHHEESQDTKDNEDIETYVFCLQEDGQWKLLDRSSGKDPFQLYRLWQNCMNLQRTYQQKASWSMEEVASALREYSTLYEQVRDAVYYSPESTFGATQWTERVQLRQIKLSALANEFYRRISSEPAEEKEQLLDLAVRSRISATEALCFMARPALRLLQKSQTEQYMRVDIELHPIVCSTILNQLRESEKELTPLQKKALTENLQYVRADNFILRDCVGNEIIAHDLCSEEPYDSAEGLLVTTNEDHRTVEEIVSSSVNTPLAVSIRFPRDKGDSSPYMVLCGRFKLLLIRPLNNSPDGAD